MQGSSWWSGGWDLPLPVQRAQVQSLVRELDSHMPQFKGSCASTTKIPRAATKTWQSQINKYKYFKRSTIKKYSKCDHFAEAIQKESSKLPPSQNLRTWRFLLIAGSHLAYPPGSWNHQLLNKRSTKHLTVSLILSWNTLSLV